MKSVMENNGKDAYCKNMNAFKSTNKN